MAQRQVIMVMNKEELMQHSMIEGGTGAPRHSGGIQNRNPLNAVTDAYVRRYGFGRLNQPEAPAFMRRLCGVTAQWPRVLPIEPETPGPVTRLLETLFSSVLGDAFPMEDPAGIRIGQ